MDDRIEYKELTLGDMCELTQVAGYITKEMHLCHNTTSTARERLLLVFLGIDERFAENWYWFYSPKFGLCWRLEERPSDLILVSTDR